MDILMAFCLFRMGSPVSLGESIRPNKNHVAAIYVPFTSAAYGVCEKLDSYALTPRKRSEVTSGYAKFHAARPKQYGARNLKKASECPILVLCPCQAKAILNPAK
ncbi:hypothetical protein [uncultured Cobetia sp.]|uniref:hypothetical protein n=1 Tax=uncultured Cobetia sp. TaxID=410706 RepID=UPI0030EE9677|tara:strand:- start:1284 stop:1598 length:315 start_codon:yes stop_codon:yes gene_type:complete